MWAWLRRTAMCLLILGAGTAPAAADLVGDAIASEEAFWDARRTGNVKRVQELLAPGFSSIESDCNGLHAMDGAGTAIGRLKKDLAEGAFGSYKLRQMGAQVFGQAVVLTVWWQSRFTPRVGGVRAIRYTSGVATVVWSKDAGGHWKRYYYHSHWRALHTHAAEPTREP